MGGKVVRQMDQQKEREVWRRVRAPGGLSAEEAVLPERLEALILEQQADAALLRGLSRRLQGAQSAALSRAAAGTEKRARELSTLHYLLSGRQLRLKTPPQPLNGPLPEALREACLRLRRSAQAFEALGAEFSDYADDFERWAGESRKQSRSLLQLLSAHTASRL